MKKVLSILSAAAVLFGAVSCSKDNLGKIKETGTVVNPLNTITVTMGSNTKVYINPELKPVFEVRDVIFGWDANGTTYEYTCTESSEDVATFTRTSSGAPSSEDGTVVNLVYAPGYSIEDITDNSLRVNMVLQMGLPIVMHTSGVVNEGECSVIFQNDVSIVDIKDAVLPDAEEGEEYTISFESTNTVLNFSLDEEDGSIVVTPEETSMITSQEWARVGADSKISKKLAVPASDGDEEVLITATGPKGTYTFSAGTKNIEAGKYIKVYDKEFTLDQQ